MGRMADSAGVGGYRTDGRDPVCAQSGHHAPLATSVSGSGKATHEPCDFAPVMKAALAVLRQGGDVSH